MFTSCFQDHRKPQHLGRLCSACSSCVFDLPHRINHPPHWKNYPARRWLRYTLHRNYYPMRHHSPNLPHWHLPACCSIHSTACVRSASFLTLVTERPATTAAIKTFTCRCQSYLWPATSGLCLKGRQHRHIGWQDAPMSCDTMIAHCHSWSIVDFFALHHSCK